MSSPPAGAPTGTATILFTDLVADLRRETGIERVALDGLDETAAGVRFPSTLWGRTVSPTRLARRGERP